MTVLVTGGTGFIGQHVVKALADLGIESDTFDFKDGQDVRNYEQVRAAVPVGGHVIHLAGILGTDELFDRIHDAIDINIKGTANVLEACRQRQAGFTGISMPQVWNNIYQATKAAAGKIAAAYHENYGVPVSHVRAFNAYGEGQKVFGVRKIVPTFAYHAWRGEPIPIWGDGSQTVDLIYAGDLADCLIDAMALGGNDVIDGGTGHALTVNDVAALVTRHTGSAAGVSYEPMRRGETPTDIVASGEGWDRIGWQPQFDMSAFERTIDSYRVLATS